MVYLFLGDGFEEIEALAPVDILRRSGIDVKTVSVYSHKDVVGSHGIKVEADLTTLDVKLGDDVEGIILPGGMPGTTQLRNAPMVWSAVRHCQKQDKMIAAICAAPIVLGDLRVLKEKEAICYPGFEEGMKCGKVSRKSVVRDGNIITAKGPGVATEFALEIVKYLRDEKTAEGVRESMCF